MSVCALSSKFNGSGLGSQSSIPERGWDISHRERVQTKYEAPPAFCPVSTQRFLLWGWSGRSVYWILISTPPHAFATASRPALVPTHLLSSEYRGALTPGIKQPGSEADQSPPFSTQVKGAWSCISTSQYVFMAWFLTKQWTNHGVVRKRRGNFTFNFTFT